MRTFRVVYNAIAYRDVEAIDEKEAAKVATLHAVQKALSGSDHHACAVNVESVNERRD